MATVIHVEKIELEEYSTEFSIEWQGNRHGKSIRSVEIPKHNSKCKQNTILRKVKKNFELPDKRG